MTQVLLRYIQTHNIPHYIAIVQTILNGMGNPKLDSFIFQVHKVQTVHFNKKRAKKFQLERIMGNSYPTGRGIKK